MVNIPEPALPGPHWVRVKNRQCGICATDLSLLYVHVDPSVGPAALPGNSRLFLGHEVVGEVTETGPGVTQFKAGDRVILDNSQLTGAGPHCLSQEITPICPFCAQGRYGLCENATATTQAQHFGGGWGDGLIAHETELYRCPDDLTDDQATLVEPMSVALHAVLRRCPQPGQQVLVIGMGIIGLLTVQAARALCPKCRITVLAKYDFQEEAARRCGADEVVRLSGKDVENYAAMAKATGARYFQAPLNKGMLSGGFDMIFDCVGNAASIENSLRWARSGGSVVVVGIDLSKIKVDLSPVWYNEVDLVGTKAHADDQWEGQRAPAYDRVCEFIRSGRFCSDGLITHRFPFEAHRQAVSTASGKAGSGAIKVVFQY